MANIRLKKGQVDPKNPQATSVRGAAKLSSVDIDNVSIEGKAAKVYPVLIPGFQKLTREDSMPSYGGLISRAGYEVKKEFNLGDGYSGDMLMIVSKDGQVGIATQGYGSCSYCDELESVHDLVQIDYSDDYKNITSDEDMAELNNRLEEIAYGTVKNTVMGDKESLIARINGETHTSWWLHDESFKEQKEAIISAIEEAFN